MWYHMIASGATRECDVRSEERAKLQRERRHVRNGGRA